MNTTTPATPSPCDPEFAPLIVPFRAELDGHPDSGAGLWPDLRIAYVNPAWEAFARANGGEAVIESWGVGANYLDAVREPEELREFLRDLLTEGASADRRHPVTHVYECCSAVDFRRFVLHVFAIPGGHGLVALHTLLESSSHSADDRPPNEADRVRYLDAHGVIRQCSHCRRIARPDGSRWDWVPVWVDAPPSETSHTICGLCLELYYPEIAEGA